MIKLTWTQFLDTLPKLQREGLYVVFDPDAWSHWQVLHDPAEMMRDFGVNGKRPSAN